MLSTDVESKGWFRKLFGINFRYHVESQVEPNAFYVLRTNKVDEQGKRVRTSEAVFDQDAKRVEYTERDPNDARQAPRVVTAALRAEGCLRRVGIRGRHRRKGQHRRRRRAKEEPRAHRDPVPGRSGRRLVASCIGWRHSCFVIRLSRERDRELRGGRARLGRDAV